MINSYLFSMMLMVGALLVFASSLTIHYWMSNNDIKIFGKKG